MRYSTRSSLRSLGVPVSTEARLRTHGIPALRGLDGSALGVDPLLAVQQAMQAAQAAAAAAAAGFPLNVVGAQVQTGAVLRPGMALRSPSGQFLALLQGDGNFVTYNGTPANVTAASPSGKAIWASNTGGGTVLIVQGDGNVVLYAGDPQNITSPSPSGKAVWATGTNGAAGPVTLKMQDDGNLVVYDAKNRNIWASVDRSGVVPVKSAWSIPTVLPTPTPTPTPTASQPTTSAKPLPPGTSLVVKDGALQIRTVAQDGVSISYAPITAAGVGAGVMLDGGATGDQTNGTMIGLVADPQGNIFWAESAWQGGMSNAKANYYPYQPGDTTLAQGKQHLADQIAQQKAAADKANADAIAAQSAAAAQLQQEQAALAAAQKAQADAQAQAQAAQAALTAAQAAAASATTAAQQQSAQAQIQQATAQVVAAQQAAGAANAAVTAAQQGGAITASMFPGGEAGKSIFLYGGIALVGVVTVSVLLRMSKAASRIQVTRVGEPVPPTMAGLGGGQRRRKRQRVRRRRRA